MQVTLGQAAKQLGIGKATLSRYIKQGKLSAAKQDDGSYRVELRLLDTAYRDQLLCHFEDNRLTITYTRTFSVMLTIRRFRVLEVPWIASRFPGLRIR